MALRISIGLNLALLSGLVLVMTEQRKKITVPPPAMVASEKPVVSVAPPVPLTPPSPEMTPPPIHWSQFVGTNDYWGFVANLRASGCPQSTVEDIVRGDIGRAFRWERNRLGLDGSGTGPWSETREDQLIASLLGEPSAHSANTVAAVQNTENSAQGNNGGGDSSEIASSQSGGSKTPLFLQNVNWSSLGFDTGDQAAIARVRQQYQDAVNLQNQNSGSATGQDSSGATGPSSSGSANQSGDTTSAQPTPTQTPLQNADDQLRNSLGSQGYAAYLQQQYYMWYQPQVMAVGGGPVTLNLPAFSPR